MKENGGLEPSEFLKRPAPVKENLVGFLVYPRASIRKLAHRFEMVEGDIKDIMLDFKSDGGTILEVEDDRFLIEVSSGKFYLPKHCVKKADS